MAVYNKIALSGSSNGRQILITGTTPPGNTLHSAIAGSTNLDEIWLYAFNRYGSDVPLNLFWGGTNAADTMTVNVPASSGRLLVTDGKLLNGGLVVSASSTSAGASGILIDGFVNRIAFDTVTDWAYRVVVNGGAAPSVGTVAALTSFVSELISNNLFSKMKSVNCFVPDNLIASITPVIKTFGFDPWTNHNFVSGDLTINGLIGNGGNKYLETGVIAAGSMLASGSQPTTSGGLTLYNTVASNTASIDMGAWSSTSDFNSQTFDLYCNYVDGNTYFDCYGAGGGGFSGGRIFTANSLWTGYLSGNRTSASSIAVYKANSSVAHTTLTSSANASNQVASNFPVYCFCVNAATAPTNFTVRRLSFAAIHDGLTSVESKALYTAVQSMRVALGGGFV